MYTAWALLLIGIACLMIDWFLIRREANRRLLTRRNIQLASSAASRNGHIPHWRRQIWFLESPPKE